MTILTEDSDRVVLSKLLRRIDEIAESLAETTAESERLACLSPQALQALCDAGLYGLNVPREAGGLGLAPAAQIRIIARLAEIDSASAWNVMVSNNTASFIAAYLPDPGFSEVFREGVPRCAGVGPRYGEAVLVDGGFRVSGVFRMCSGADYAEWFRFHTVLTVGGVPRSLFVIVPRSDVRLLGNWEVLGLRGSGSPDAALDAVLVPEHMAIFEEIPLRGGPQFRQRDLPAAAYEHAAIAVGLGRRAVRAAVAAIASRATRHETALNAIGRASVNLEMVSLAVEAEFTRVCELLSDPETDADAVSADNPAIAAHAMEVALDCVRTAYRLAGATAIYTPNAFERLLRDANAAGQHACVQDFHFTNVGRRLLDAADRDR